MQLSLGKALGAVVLALIASATLAGCSKSKPISPPQMQESEVLVEEDVTPAAPVEVEVGQAFIEADKLRIKVYVNPKTEVSASDVVVAVIGLREGEVVETKIKHLSDELADSVLVPGTKVALHYTLDAEDLTEYQVRCSWGDAADEFISSKAVKTTPATTRASLATAKDDTENKRAKSKLEFRDQVISSEATECSEQPCDLLYTLETKLTNVSKSSISEIVLALGIYWVEGEGSSVSSNAFPEFGQELLVNEEEIELKTLTLSPERHKSLRVRVDRPVPIVPGGKFMPHLRVIKYQIIN